MIEFFVSIVIIVAFFASLYGWGRLILKRVDKSALSGPAYCVVIGLSSWISLGGLLNALGIAYPATLYALVLAGLGAAWNFPEPESTEALEEYLRALGVRYVLWESRGYGVLHPALLEKYRTSPYPNVLGLRKAIEGLARRYSTVHADQQMILLDLSTPLP